MLLLQFLPILRSAIDNNWYLSSRDFESVDVQLESSAIMTLASRTQQHFAHLADRVSSEQNAIDESIRRTEVVTARASAALAQRQKNATRMAGAAAEIQSMIKTLTSLQAATQRLSESCRQLNALLPESVQEPLNGPSPTSVFAATASSLASPVPTSTPSSGSAPVRRQLIPPAIGIDLYFDGSSPRSPSKSQRSSAAPSPAPKVIDRASPVPEATPPEAPPVPPSPAPSVADDPIVFDELKEALSSNMQE
ncbi:hypothetical protein, variant [Capsaspora owczarzaki ATCC 30864]|uniref:BLOC-1-related complex subunit 5 n=1 Tax=Capsaspora owczarzaki (strain ATCC 30864) TaxID=595528 RepID=A0A0D2U071_CAPO3|nr:hypothetical protein, variant [Capsaspora owczarzaki ATCC 30864]